MSNLDAIISIVSDAFGVPGESLKRRHGPRWVSWARFAMVDLLSGVEPKLSTTKIGEAMGVNHSTIIHARRRANELKQPRHFSARWRERYEAARARFEQSSNLKQLPNCSTWNNGIARTPHSKVI